jgi:hypothetical protein
MDGEVRATVVERMVRLTMVAGQLKTMELMLFNTGPRELTGALDSVLQEEDQRI